MESNIVEVKLTGVEPVVSFISAIAQAEAKLYSMSPDEVKSLPDKAAEAMAEIQDALGFLSAAGLLTEH